jgi:hypothetical protein
VKKKAHKSRIRHDGVEVVPAYIWIPKSVDKQFDELAKLTKPAMSKHKLLVKAVTFWSEIGLDEMGIGK